MGGRYRNRRKTKSMMAKLKQETKHIIIRRRRNLMYKIAAEKYKILSMKQRKNEIESLLQTCKIGLRMGVLKSKLTSLENKIVYCESRLANTENRVEEMIMHRSRKIRKSRTNAEISAYEYYVKLRERRERSSRCDIYDYTTNGPGLWDDEDSDITDGKDDDEEWLPDDKAHKKSSSRRKMSKRRVLDKILGSSKDLFDEDECLEEDSTSKYQFASDLQELDNEPSFGDQTLIVIEFQKGSAFPYLDLKSIKKLPISAVKSNINSVIAVKRSLHGQLYLFQGLQSKLHFSVGINGLRAIESIFNHKGIPFYILKGAHNEVQPKVVHVESKRINRNCDFENILQAGKRAASHFITHLFDQASSSTERVSYSLNFGLTDQKCHEYQFYNCFNGVLPGLISIKKPLLKDTIARHLLITLADLLAKDYIPRTKLSGMMPNYSEYAKEQLVRFGTQLLCDDITKEDGYYFPFPAVSVIVPSLLRPHCDLLNPSGEHDITTLLSVRVFIASLPPEVQSKINDTIGHEKVKYIPVSFVFYPRRCLSSYESKKGRVSKYISRPGLDLQARCAIVECAENVNSTYNYRTRFFTASGYDQRSNECTNESGSWFAGACGKSEEAIDKNAWTSIIVHCFLCRVARHGISLNSTVDIVIFVGRDSNTTILYAEAMRRLRDTPEKTGGTKKSFYRLLGETCYQIKADNRDTTMDLSLEESFDLGCGQGCRFVCSANKFLSESELKDIRHTIKLLIFTYDDKMKRADDDFTKLKIVFELQHELEKRVNGVGPLRAQLIIQLCALFGLISLNFYEYLPCHLSGGVGKFMVEKACYSEPASNIDSLLKWNVSSVKEIQVVYGKNFTYNIYEQLACCISRYFIRYDYFFKMQWLDTSGAWTPSRLQLFFRYDAINKNMQGYDGCNRHVIISEKKPAEGLLEWERTEDGRIKSSCDLRIDIKSNTKYINIYKNCI